LNICGASEHRGVLIECLINARKLLLIATVTFFDLERKTWHAVDRCRWLRRRIFAVEWSTSLLLYSESLGFWLGYLLSWEACRTIPQSCQGHDCCLCSIPIYYLLL